MINRAKGTNPPAADHGDNQDQSSNYLLRFSEVTRYSGSPAQAVFYATDLANTSSAEQITADIQIGNVIGNGAGLLAGLVIHSLVKYRKGKISSNPLYRNFKTLASFGWQLGTTIGNLLGIENPNKSRLISCILSDVSCFFIGLIAIPYWFIRDKVYHIKAGKRHRYAVTGREGWSKYAKTALAFGTAVGQVIGGLFAAIMSNASSVVVSFGINFWGAVVGVCGFLVSLVAVPLINWATTGKGYQLRLASDDKEITIENISEKTIMLKKYNDGKLWAYYRKGGVLTSVGLDLTSEESKELLKNLKEPSWVEEVTSQCAFGALASNHKNHIRNNYTRSGMILGAGLGAVAGLCIGNWVFGVFLGGIIFSAVGSVVAGIVFSLISHQLHEALHPVPKDQKIYLEKNGWQINAYYLKKNKKLPIYLTTQEIAELCSVDAKKHKASFENIYYQQIENLNNSWDYVTRSTASVFGFIGAAVVCWINPAAVFLLVPIGTAIASAIGWCCGLLIVHKANQLQEEEENSTGNTLPWTQRLSAGTNIGSIIGSSLGVAIGLAGFVFTGPASVILAISFFGALGAVIGSICAVLWDASDRQLIWKGIKSFFVTPSHEPNSTSTKEMMSALSEEKSESPSTKETPRRTMDVTVVTSRHTFYNRSNEGTFFEKIKPEKNDFIRYNSRTVGSCC